MEKLQQLLQQQQQQQQQIQNQLYQNSFRKDDQPPREEDEEETGEEDIEEEDESLQEFLQPQSQQQQQQSQEQQSRRSSKPELPAAQEQLLQQKLSELQSSQSKKQQAPAPPVLQQQEPKKPEFSVRHQPIPQPVSQQPSQQGQKSQAPPPPPAQQQPAAMLNGDHLKHESDLTKPPSIQVSQFDRKFRNSWRKSPEDFTTKQQQQQQQQMVTKKASKLSENDISSQADEEGEEGDITEDDVYRLHDELEHAHLQNNEMKKALNEARTIIDQQQNQLTEFRRLAAQYQTDTEAFKMKSMFLLNNTQTRDEQVTVLMEACERLEAEIDALTWQLDQAKHSLDLKTQECDFLNEQLDEIQLNAGSNSTMNHNHINTNNNNLMNGNGHHDSADHIIAENMDKANTGTDQLRSTLSTEYRSIIGNNNNNNHTGHMNTMSTGLNMNAANDLSLHMELQKLQEEIEVYRKKEEDWEKIHVELLQRQKILEEEKKQQELVIGRLAGEQVAKNKAENPQDNDVENDIPLEIVATLNNLHEEKTTWKLYASSLVRSFVENCEEFIRKTPYNEPYFESDGERRWYTYSMHLLENLLHVAPYMLAKSDLDLLKRTATTTTKTAFQQKRNPYLSGGGGHGSSVSEPQLITTSDFPLSASQIQLQNRNMNAGQLTTSEFAQLSASSVSLAPPMLSQSSMQQQSMLGQEQQLFTQMSYPSGMSTQKNMSERAARAASKSIPDLYRKKKQR